MPYSTKCPRCDGKGRSWLEDRCAKCAGTGEVAPYRAHVTQGDWWDAGFSDRIHSWREVPGVLKKHCRVCLTPCTGRAQVWCGDRACKMAHWNRMYNGVHWIKRSLIVERGCACEHCGEVFEKPIDPRGPAYPCPGLLQVDHFVPLIDGGTDFPDNLQLLCEDCHKAKTAREAADRAAARRGVLPSDTGVRHG